MSAEQIVVLILVALISALIGTGTGGFIVAWKRDKRQVPLDAEAARKARIDVADMIERLATRAVERATEQLTKQEEEARLELREQEERNAKELRTQEERHRVEIERLHQRIGVLEDAVRKAGAEVPPWTS
jgi:hypothetical protein